MTLKYALLALAAPMALIAAPVDAAVYDFQLTGDYTASWTIDTDLVDSYAEDTQGFGFYDVSGTFDGVRKTAFSINFFSAINGGGLSIELDDAFPAWDGVQLYSGAERDLAFRPGTFSFGDTTLTTSVAVAAVPEPASWLLMIAGFGLVGGAMRVRRTAVCWKAA